MSLTMLLGSSVSLLHVPPVVALRGHPLMLPSCIGHPLGGPWAMEGPADVGPWFTGHAGGADVAALELTSGVVGTEEVAPIPKEKKAQF